MAGGAEVVALCVSGRISAFPSGVTGPLDLAPFVLDASFCLSVRMMTWFYLSLSTVAFACMDFEDKSGVGSV